MSAPGMDDAIEAAAAAIDEYVGEDHPEWYEPHALVAIEAAYPHIAAAVRVDERARVLAEVEAARLTFDALLSDTGTHAWLRQHGSPEVRQSYADLERMLAEWRNAPSGTASVPKGADRG